MEGILIKKFTFIHSYLIKNEIFAIKKFIAFFVEFSKNNIFY